MGRLERVVVGVSAAGVLLVSVRQSFELRALRAENAQLRKEIGMLAAELESLRPKDEERFNGACGDGEGGSTAEEATGVAAVARRSGIAAESVGGGGRESGGGREGRQSN